MKTNTGIATIGVFAALSLTVTPKSYADPATSLAPAYRLVDLGDLPGGLDYGFALQVNDAGQVIGRSSSTSSGSSANTGYIWDATNGMRELSGTFPNGINNQGVIVGMKSPQPHQAFKWDSVNGIQSLGAGVVGSYSNYQAMAINNAGAIAYENWGSNTAPCKAYFLTGGTATWVGELYSGGATSGIALNNKDELVGNSITSNLQQYQAYFWKSGQGIFGLGVLPGFTNSGAAGINDASQVVGGCWNSGGTGVAFIWTSGTGMVQLDSSGIGGSNCWAAAINAGGVAVGYGNVAGDSHALAWAPGQNAVDINTLVPDRSGWVLIKEAVAVNSAGMIVGRVLRTNGATHACILYPLAAPAITTQPLSQVGYWGKSVTLSVAATGVAPLSYQWFKDGVPIDGATDFQLVLTNLQVAAGGNYTVVVTDGNGLTQTSNAATLEVNPAGVSIALYAGVKIEGVVGKTYGIQATTDPANGGSWVGVANITLSDATQIWYDSQPASLGKRFYRVTAGSVTIP